MEIRPNIKESYILIKSMKEDSIIKVSNVIAVVKLEEVLKLVYIHRNVPELFMGILFTSLQ